MLRISNIGVGDTFRLRNEPKRRLEGVRLECVCRCGILEGRDIFFVAFMLPISPAPCSYRSAKTTKFFGIKRTLMLLAVFRMKWSGKLTTVGRPDSQGALKVDACFSWLAKRYGNSWQSHAIK